MKKVLIALISLFFLFSWNNKVEASHIAGADISYECLGGDTYKLTLNVFRDCGGIDFTFAPASFSITSACGGNVTANWTQVNVPSNLPFSGTGTEVSQLCGAELPNSECNIGTGGQPGLVQFTYEATVVLAPPCSSWTFGYDVVCCRNTNLNLGTGSADSYVESTLNTDSCNNSPVFEAQPIPYVCAGQPVVYNFGTTETDGDSLVYSFVPGFNAPGVNLTYTNSNPFTNPFTGFVAGTATIDPATGEVSFIPTVTGNLVLVVQVDEYRNGVLVGSVMRDIQFVVEICSNNQPNDVAQILNFSGTGSQIDDNSVEVCIGETFTFDIGFSDDDAVDSLEFTSNIQSVLPGATFTITYPSAPTSYDTAVVSVSWVAVPVQGNFYSFTIEAQDGACPIPGIYYATFDVRIVTSTFAGFDQTICQFTQSADLSVSGGSQFTWTSISGDPLNVGQNFSCDTCQLVNASPNSTTCYQVVSDLSSSCKNVDTVCVIVAPNYNLDITDDTLICSAVDIPLEVIPSDPTQTYTYQWNNQSTLNNNTISNPVASPDRPLTYRVTVESDSGCRKIDEVAIDISNPFPSNIQPIADDTLLCNSGTVNFDVDWDGVTPPSCGIATRPCIGTGASYIVGISANLNSQGFGAAGYPAPFNTYTPSSKQQYLYRAADLQAAGVPAGQITALKFEVVQTGSASILNEYTIRMRCTSKDDLDQTSFESGLVTVRNAAPYQPTTGLNTITLDNPYDWDGQSNLIVEICYNNSGGTTGAGTNYTTPYRNTSYSGTAFASSSTFSPSNQCPTFTQNGASPLNRVPDIQFEVCSGVDPNGFNFSWLPTGPGGGFSGPTNVKTPSANVTLLTDSIYTLIVTDTSGVCTDTSSIQISVVDEYDVKPKVEDLCITAPATFLSANTPYDIVPRPDGGFWSGDGIVNDSLGLWDPGLSGIGTFWVVYEVTGDACANRDSSQITIIPAPDPTITTAGPFCENDTAIALNAVLTGGQWYNTQFPSSVDSSGVLNATLISSSTARIIHQITVAGCTERDTAIIALEDGFVADINPIGIQCPDGAPVQLVNAGGAGGSWSGPGVNNSGLFDPTLVGEDSVVIVTLDSAGNCGATDQITIVVDTFPTINIAHFEGPPATTPRLDGEPSVYCANDNTPITVVPDAFARGNWTHINNWTPLDQPAYVPSTLAPGEYQSVYELTSLNGCVSRDTVTIRIARVPAAPDAVDDSICAGDFGEIRAEKDSANFNIIWYADEQLNDSINFGEALALQGVTENVTFYAVQKNERCYGDPTEVSVTVNPSVEAAFTSSTEGGPEPLEINFNNQTNTNNTEVSYEWFYVIGPADTAFSTEENTSRVFDYNKTLETGNYSVLLVATNQFGCTDTAIQNIVIDAVAELIIPNVFTPPSEGGSGDGFNDSFAPVVEGLRTFEGIIYNRWGRKVGEMTLGNPTWDGTDIQNGEVMPDGVYYYVIKGEAFNGTNYDESGTVTLIRQQ